MKLPSSDDTNDSVACAADFNKINVCDKTIC